jgi:hypothetical protein
MTMVTRAVASIGVLLALTTPAWAQANAEVQADPIGWLQGHLGGAACVVYEAGPSPLRMERIVENTEVQFDGCHMVLQQAGVDGSHSDVRTLDVHLERLDAKSVTVREWDDLPAGWTSKGDVPARVVGLTVPDGQPPFDSHVESFNGLAPTTFQTPTLDILVLHKESAAQIVQALTLAIESCRAHSSR